MKPASKKLLSWVLLVFVFVAVRQVLTPGRPSPPSAPITLGSWLPMAIVVGAVVALAVGFQRVVAAARRHNVAILASRADLEAGRFEAAERAVEGLSRSRLPQFRRTYHAQRAEIAARSRDRDEALARVDGAVEAPVGWFFRGSQRRIALAAQGLRAFLRASAGDEAGAREDIAALRADPEAAPGELARAALAEALLLDRAGDRAGLRALLARSRSLLLAAAPLRERALLRAYEAMLEASPTSVYRQQGDRPAPGDEAAAITAWVACYAPNAAPFVRAGAVHAGGKGIQAEAPSDEARRLLAASRSSDVKEKQGLKAIGLWTVLVLMFVGVWGWLVPSVGPRFQGPLVAGGTFLLLFGLAVRQIRRTRREARHLNRVARAVNAGDLDRAAAALAVEPKAPLQRAQTAHLRAEVALRRGEMSEALAHCDRAFSLLALFQGGKVRAPVAPARGQKPAWDLHRLIAAQRAFALAALGRGDEAWAEIEWAQGLPEALSIFRVALLGRLVAGDFAGAARVFERREPAMPLPARDEVLGELARFAGRTSARSPAEAARLRAELRHDPDLARWIEAVSPGLAAAFERAAAEVDAAGAVRPERASTAPAG